MAGFSLILVFFIFVSTISGLLLLAAASMMSKKDKRKNTAAVTHTVGCISLVPIIIFVIVITASVLIKNFI